MDVKMTSKNLKNIVAAGSTLLDDKQAAEYLTVTAGTLSVWRCTGRHCLPFIKVGHAVRYRLSDLDAWLEGRVRANGATD